MAFANTFPALPGVDVEVTREPQYKTKTFEAVSGKEVRASWRTTKRVLYTLRFNFLRSTVAAPSPLGAYSEAAVLDFFLDGCKGSFDQFTWAAPVDGSVTVRLVEDSITYKQLVPGIWVVDSLQLITVL